MLKKSYIFLFKHINGNIYMKKKTYTRMVGQIMPKKSNFKYFDKKLLKFKSID